MAPHPLASIYKVRDEINQLNSIPTGYSSLLEHRLIIACSEFKRQDRGEAVRPHRENKTRHIEKRAHKLYLDVLDVDPQIFIPFLLIVNTNNACVRYKLELFRQQHNQRVKICLGNADKVFLEDIARRHGIGGSQAFQKLIHALFPATPRTATAVDGGPKPSTIPRTATAVDGGPTPNPWRFNGPHLDVVRSQFAVGVFEAICKAPAKCGNVQFSTQTTTGSVWMDLPSVSKEDCSLWLVIGDTDLFEKVLFPAGCRIQKSGHDGSDGRYSLQRACCAAATLIFGSQLYEAIDTSRLRTWERETAGLTDTTDCITIEVHATHQPRYGILCLRLEFLRGLKIAHRLFAIPNVSDI